MGGLLLLHQGAIGDFVLTLSVLQEVRKTLNPPAVTAVASASSAQLAAGRSAIDLCLHPDSVGLHRLFADESPLTGRIAELLHDADLVISFLGCDSSPVHQRLRAHARGRVVSIDPRPMPETLTRRRHITSQWADVIRAAGLAIDEPSPPRIRIEGIRPPTADTRTPARVPTVIIHPGSGGHPKCWPIEHFLSLADALQVPPRTPEPSSPHTSPGIDLHWMLGPAELDASPHVSETVRRRADARGERLVIEPEIEKAAVRIAAADVYVGNDAGMTHLAAAIGLPTVAVFTATDPHVWRPLGDHVEAIAVPENADTAETRSFSGVLAATQRLITSAHPASRSP